MTSTAPSSSLGSYETPTPYLRTTRAFLEVVAKGFDGLDRVVFSITSGLPWHALRRYEGYFVDLGRSYRPVLPEDMFNALDRRILKLAVNRQSAESLEISTHLPEGIRGKRSL